MQNLGDVGIYCELIIFREVGAVHAPPLRINNNYLIFIEKL
jgi:hypothetical protein